MISKQSVKRWYDSVYKHNVSHETIEIECVRLWIELVNSGLKVSV